MKMIGDTAAASEEYCEQLTQSHICKYEYF